MLAGVLRSIEFRKAVTRWSSRKDCKTIGGKFAREYAVSLRWSDGSCQCDVVQWVASGAGRSGYRFVEIPKLYLKLFAAEERWQLHAEEEAALLQYQPHLPHVLPRCYGRFLTPLMDNALHVVEVDVLVLE